MNQQFQPRDNSGNLFKNDKGDNPNRPDYRGDAMVNGEMVQISAWIKEGAKGKFMSLSFSPKEERQAPAPARVQQPVQRRPQGVPADFGPDNDIPF